MCICQPSRGPKWQVGPQASRLGPVAAVTRVWWLSPKLKVLDIGRGKIMYVETIYFNVKWALQPFRSFTARFEVDEFQARYAVARGRGVRWEVTR